MSAELASEDELNRTLRETLSGHKAEVPAGFGLDEIPGAEGTVATEVSLKDLAKFLTPKHKITQEEAELCLRTIVQTAKQDLSPKEIDQLQNTTGAFIGKVNWMPPRVREWHPRLAKLGVAIYLATKDAEFTSGTCRLLHGTSLAFHACGDLETTLTIQQGLGHLMFTNPGAASDGRKLVFARDFSRALTDAGMYQKGREKAEQFLPVAEKAQDSVSYVVLLRTQAKCLAAEGKFSEALEVLSDRPTWTRPKDPAQFNALEMDFDLELAFLEFLTGKGTQDSLLAVAAHQRDASVENEVPNYAASREKLVGILLDHHGDELKTKILQKMIPG